MVRVDRDGTVLSRASSHNGYNYDGSVGSGCSTRASPIAPPGLRPAGRSCRVEAMPATCTRTARLSPTAVAETLDRRALETRFAITPPWLKIVYTDPEWEGT